MFHPNLRVIRDDDFWYSAEEGQRSNVAADPIREIFGPMCFGVGVAAGPQGGDEDVGLPDLTGFQIDDAHRLTSVVHEHLLSGLVSEPHGRVQLPGPQTVELAEATVSVAIGMGFPTEGRATAGGVLRL